jgi:hypothetical protein
MISDRESMKGVNSSGFSDMGRMRLGRLGRMGRMGQREAMWAYRVGTIANSVPDLTPMDPFPITFAFQNSDGSHFSVSAAGELRPARQFVEILDSFNDKEPI